MPHPSTQSLTFKAYELRAIVVDCGSNGPSAGQVLYSCDGRETRCLFGQCFILPIADLSRTKKKPQGEFKTMIVGLSSMCQRSWNNALPSPCPIFEAPLVSCSSLHKRYQGELPVGKGPTEIKPPPPNTIFPSSGCQEQTACREGDMI